MNLQQQNMLLLCSAVLIQCTAALFLTTIIRRKRQRQRRRRLSSVHHAVNKRRNAAEGYYNKLFVELREDPQHFYKYTRMSLQQFDDLMDMIVPHLPQQSTSRDHMPIPPHMLLLITLRHLATGDSILTLAKDYRIDEGTCIRLIKETCNAITAALQPRYLASPTKEQFSTIADEFWCLWNLPHCLGSIDGKYIIIKTPGPLCNTTFSLVLMAVCDANYCFTLVDIGHCDSLSDGSIFRSSIIGENILNDTLDIPTAVPLPDMEGENAIPSPYYFVGDEAFPLLHNLMTPYGKTHLQGQSAKSLTNKSFNYKIKTARRIVENSFGIFTAKWQIFHKTIESSPDDVVSFAQACVCLHNYLLKTKENGINIPQGTYVDICNETNEIIVPGLWREEADGTKLKRVPIRSNRFAPENARKLRDRLAEYIVWRDNLM